MGTAVLSPDKYQICFRHSYLCFVLLLCLDSDIRCLQVHLNDTVIACSTFLLNLFSILKKELVAFALPLFRLQPALSPPLLGLGAWGLQSANNENFAKHHLYVQGDGV